LLGGESFKAKPYYQGGWEKYNKIISELLDKAIYRVLCPLKFLSYEKLGKNFRKGK